MDGLQLAGDAMMENFYIWPGSPVASLFVLWVASVIFLWAGRSAMLQLTIETSLRVAGARG